MTVKDVLKIAVIYLGKEEYLDLTDFGGTMVKTESQESDIASLVRCLNLVIKEVASEYYPIKEEQTLQATNNKILFSSFNNLPLDVVNVKDSFGDKIKFATFSTYIKVDDGTYDILYTYLPDDITLLSNMPAFDAKITSRVFAYGLAMEYSYISQLFDDASLWEKRYKDSLNLCLRTAKEKMLPRRRWL